MSKKLVTGIVVGTVALALIGAGAIVAQIISEEEIKESQKKIKDKIESSPIVQKDVVIGDIFSIDNTNLTKQNFLVPIRDIHLG